MALHARAADGLASVRLAQGLDRPYHHRPMPDFLERVSTLVLAAYLLAFFGFLTVGNVLIGFAAERWVPSKRIFAVPLAEGQLRHELIGNLVFVLVTVLTMTVVLASGVVRFGESSLGLGVETFVVILFGFQVFYYFLHRGMHHRSLLWMHRWHHRSQVTTPLSAQSVHIVESLGWMLGYAGLPLLLSFCVPDQLLGLGCVPRVQRERQHRRARQRRARVRAQWLTCGLALRKSLGLSRAPPRALDGPLWLSSGVDGSPRRNRVERLARAVHARARGSCDGEPQGARR